MRESFGWGLTDGHRVLHSVRRISLLYDTLRAQGSDTVYFESISSGDESNTLKPRQNGRRFSDDVFNCIVLNENAWIFFKISLNFVLKGPINNIPALDQTMAWRRAGDKPLSESIMIILPTHICVTWPQWVHYRKLTVVLKHNTPTMCVGISLYALFVAFPKCLHI